MDSNEAKDVLGKVVKVLRKLESEEKIEDTPITIARLRRNVQEVIEYLDELGMK